MKYFVAIAFCAVLATIAVARAEEKYTDQFDGVDVDEILKNERLYQSYVHCLKTGEKCTPDGKKLRETIPDALQTGCSKCTEVQDRQSKRVIRFLVEKKQEDFKELEKIFDPERKYRTIHADKLKADGIVLPD